MKDHLLFASNHSLNHTSPVPQNFTGKRSSGTRKGSVWAPPVNKLGLVVGTEGKTPSCQAEVRSTQSQVFSGEKVEQRGKKAPLGLLIHVLMKA